MLCCVFLVPKAGIALKPRFWALLHLSTPQRKPKNEGLTSPRTTLFWLQGLPAPQARMQKGSPAMRAQARPACSANGVLQDESSMWQLVNARISAVACLDVAVCARVLPFLLEQLALFVFPLTFCQHENARLCIGRTQRGAHEAWSCRQQVTWCPIKYKQNIRLNARLFTLLLEDMATNPLLEGQEPATAFSGTLSRAPLSLQSAGHGRGAPTRQEALLFQLASGGSGGDAVSAV